MKKYILLLSTLCLGLVSCVKENMPGVDADGLTTFRAVYADASTKTVLDGLVPMWTPEDTISIYDGNNNRFFNSLTANAKTAEYKGKLEGQGIERGSFIAASPYSADYTFSFVGSFVGGMMVPAVQTAVEGTYDPAAAPAAAFADTTRLSFHNAYSLVKFTVVSDGVTEVELVGNEGETIAGKMNVAKADPLRITVTQAETKVTLKGEFKKGSTYYMSTAPATLKSGIAVTLKTADGKSVESMKYTSAVALERSGIINLGNLSLNPNESGNPDNSGENGGNPGDNTGDNPDVTPAAGTVYFRPNSNWLEADARFAAYFWQEGLPEVWVDLTADSVSGVFKCEVPSGYTNIIFVRMNPESSTNSWDDGVKWGQTADLSVPTGDNVCFVLEADSWDSGYWTTYPPAVNDDPVTPDPGTGTEPDNPGDSDITACRLTVKVNKSIDWYDKYIYSWENNQPTLGDWPGTKMGWVGEEGDYYVYYHDFDKSLNGTTINYIINKGEGGAGNQTLDLTVTLNGANTTVTIETGDIVK